MKDIINFEGYYQIDEYGNIINRHGRKLRNSKNRYGYMFIRLSKENKEYIFTIHRLVAIHYIPNPENLSEVNHKDGDKSNNHISNLEWSTRKQNLVHAHSTGLKVVKLTNEIANEIRNKYIPRLYTQSRLAEEYGVQPKTISAIITRTTHNY